MVAMLRKVARTAADNTWLILVLRLSLGAIFIISSVSKLPDQAEFTSKVLSYGMLPEVLARPFAAVLPFFELFAGCTLVLGVFIRFTSALSIPLILSFIVANAYALTRGVGDFYCGCLGNLVNLNHASSLAIDFAMVLAACLLVVKHEKAERLGLGSLLDRKRWNLGRIQGIALKMALVGLAMVVVIAFVGTQPSSKQAQIDDALKEGKVVLLFIYQGDPAESQEQRAIVADLEARYPQELSVVRHKVGSDPILDRMFPVNGPATLLVITGKTGDRYVAPYRFEGAVDGGTVEAAIIESIPDNTP